VRSDASERRNYSHEILVISLETFYSAAVTAIGEVQS